MLYYKVEDENGEIRGVFGCSKFDEFLEVRDEYAEETDNITQIDEEEFYKLESELKMADASDPQVKYVYGTSQQQDAPNYSDVELKLMILNWSKTFSTAMPTVSALNEYFMWFKQQ